MFICLSVTFFRRRTVFGLDTLKRELNQSRAYATQWRRSGRSTAEFENFISFYYIFVVFVRICLIR